jgi:hypothetical protein
MQRINVACRRMFSAKEPLSTIRGSSTQRTLDRGSRFMFDREPIRVRRAAMFDFNRRRVHSRQREREKNSADGTGSRMLDGVITASDRRYPDEQPPAVAWTMFVARSTPSEFIRTLWEFRHNGRRCRRANCRKCEVVPFYRHRRRILRRYSQILFFYGFFPIAGIMARAQPAFVWASCAHLETQAGARVRQGHRAQMGAFVM